MQDYYLDTMIIPACEHCGDRHEGDECYPGMLEYGPESVSQPGSGYEGTPGHP